MKPLFLVSIISICLFSSCTVQADCSKIYDLAFKSQMERQKGNKYHFDTKDSRLLHAIDVETFHRPQYFGASMREQTAEEFAEEFEYACKHNIYGN